MTSYISVVSIQECGVSKRIWKVGVEQSIERWVRGNKGVKVRIWGDGCIECKHVVWWARFHIVPCCNVGNVRWQGQGIRAAARCTYIHDWGILIWHRPPAWFTEKTLIAWGISQVRISIKVVGYTFDKILLATSSGKAKCLCNILKVRFHFCHQGTSKWLVQIPFESQLLMLSFLCSPLFLCFVFLLFLCFFQYLLFLSKSQTLLQC